MQPVIQALDKADFKVRKECVWVITNYTSGGNFEQIVYLLQNDVIPPLCSMLNVQDLKSVNVALDSISHILHVSIFYYFLCYNILKFKFTFKYLN